MLFRLDLPFDNFRQVLLHPAQKKLIKLSIHTDYHNRINIFAERI